VATKHPHAPLGQPHHPGGDGGSRRALAGNKPRRRHGGRVPISKHSELQQPGSLVRRFMELNKRQRHRKLGRKPLGMGDFLQEIAMTWRTVDRINAALLVAVVVWLWVGG